MYHEQIVSKLTFYFKITLIFNTEDFVNTRSGKRGGGGNKLIANLSIQQLVPIQIPKLDHQVLCFNATNLKFGSITHFSLLFPFLVSQMP